MVAVWAKMHIFYYSYSEDLTLLQIKQTELGKATRVFQRLILRTVYKEQ